MCSGGVLFVAPAAGRQISVSGFVINLEQGGLTGIVNGNPKARGPLFTPGLEFGTASTQLKF